MRKAKGYPETRFSADVLREGVDKMNLLVSEAKVPWTVSSFTVKREDASWQYDHIDEFLADLRTSRGYAYLSLANSTYGLTVTYYEREVQVAVLAPTRAEIEAIFDAFERNALQAKLPPEKKAEVKAAKPVVFIGHGRSTAWRDLKDHLHDKHGVQIEAYETGARAGHTIRDILEDMVAKSSFAIIVMTAEDEQADGQMRARQNVIHEAGLFQGRLGFPRAILLLEEGVEEFSNVQGVQYIRFSKGNIKETFGEVLATLRREFPS